MLPLQTFFLILNDQLRCSVPKIALNHVRKHLNTHMQEANYIDCSIFVCFSLVHRICSLTWNKITPLIEITTEVFSALMKIWKLCCC